MKYKETIFLCAGPYSLEYEIHSGHYCAKDNFFSFVISEEGELVDHSIILKLFSLRFKGFKLSSKEKDEKIYFRPSGKIRGAHTHLKSHVKKKIHPVIREFLLGLEFEPLQKRCDDARFWCDQSWNRFTSIPAPDRLQEWVNSVHKLHRAEFLLLLARKERELRRKEINSPEISSFSESSIKIFDKEK